MSRPTLPIRIGVLGAAAIARDFIKGSAPSKLLRVTAVASRTADKAAAFARDTGIERTFASYAAMLADPDIDAVYNPLPNGLHAEWSIRALDARKHVLCEKPLAASEAEAKAMFAAAQRNGVHLVEAYPYLAQSMTLEVRKLVNTGVIGKPQLIRASFGIPFSDPSNIRLIADLAGGAVMDVGSYSTSFIRVMANERPRRVHAVAQWGATGVDRTVAGTFEFPSGLLAQVGASFATGYHRHGQVAGDAGCIDTMFLNHPPIGGPAAFQLRRGTMGVTPIETIPVAVGNGFLAEAESFAKLVSSGDLAAWTGATAQESIDIAAMLEALIKSARQGTAVDI